MNKKITLTILSFFILLSLVSALGISPGRFTVEYNPKMSSGTGAFNIINSDGEDITLSVSVRGELANTLTLDGENKRITLKKSDGPYLFRYLYALPDNLPPGQSSAEIVITQIPDNINHSETYVGATIAVAHQFYVNVPYPGKYAEADIDIVSMNSGQETLFVIPVISKGKFDLVSVRANVDIFDAEGIPIHSFNTESIEIKSGEMKELRYIWDTESLPLGEYYAEVTVIYDGETINMNKRFSIGDQVLELQDIYVHDFSLGEIVKMEMLVQSNWNKIITDAYSRTRIYDEAGNVLADFNSANYDIDPKSKKVIVSYWDTAGVREGTYDTKISLEYGQDSIENDLQLAVSQNDLQVIGLGYVISSGGDIGGSGGGNTMTILIVVVVILVLVNLLWFMVLRKYLSKNKTQ